MISLTQPPRVLRDGRRGGEELPLGPVGIVDDSRSPVEDQGRASPEVVRGPPVAGDARRRERGPAAAHLLRERHSQRVRSSEGDPMRDVEDERELEAVLRHDAPREGGVAGHRRGVVEAVAVDRRVAPGELPTYHGCRPLAQPRGTNRDEELLCRRTGLQLGEHSDGPVGVVSEAGRMMRGNTRTEPRLVERPEVGLGIELEQRGVVRGRSDQQGDALGGRRGDRAERVLRHVQAFDHGPQSVRRAEPGQLADGQTPEASDATSLDENPRGGLLGLEVVDRPQEDGPALDDRAPEETSRGRQCQ